MLRFLCSIFGLGRRKMAGKVEPPEPWPPPPETEYVISDEALKAIEWLTEHGYDTESAIRRLLETDLPVNEAFEKVKRELLEKKHDSR